MQRSPRASVLVPLAAESGLRGEHDTLPLVGGPAAVFVGEVEPNLFEPGRQYELGVGVPARETGFFQATPNRTLAGRDTQFLSNFAGAEERFVHHRRYNQEVLILSCRSRTPPVWGVSYPSFVPVRVDDPYNCGHGAAYFGGDGSLRHAVY